MAEDDIYGNKENYERFIERIDTIEIKSKSRKYYCVNEDNKKYFRQLIDYFEARDLSYIRRYRLLYTLLSITSYTEQDVALCDRDEINRIVASFHKTHRTPISKEEVVKNMKVIWKYLFPERDTKGRVDDTITPYAVRHLSRKTDKSREKRRNDRLSAEEFQRIVNFFSNDKRMQAYLMLAFESLGRPQEILYTKIKDYEFYDNFAKVWISEHGKEGTGFLQCIDSYPYVVEWYQSHPLKDNPNSFFFINTGKRDRYDQMKNLCINKRLAYACRTLGIEKKISCYSLKRNGVTFRRQRGDSDVQIQHAARWTSTKQMKIYDMTTQEDALTIELRKRGIMQQKTNEIDSKIKPCSFCSYRNGFTAEFCTNCKRPLDRKKIEEMASSQERLVNNQLLQRLNTMEKMFERMISQRQETLPN